MKKTDALANNFAEKYFDVAEVMLVVINADQTVDRINRKGCKILGYKEKEIIGKNWFDNFLPEEIRNDVKAVFDKLIKGKIEPVEYYENSVLTKNGEERIIAWHNTILKDEDGMIVCAISSGEDITDREQAIERLEERERKYKSLFEYAGDALFIMDFPEEQGPRFLECNDRTLKLFGCKSRDQIIGKSPVDFSPPKQPDGQSSYEKTHGLVDNVMKGRPQFFNWEHCRLDGTPFNVEVTLSPIELKDKFLMQAVVRDITERRHIEEEILSVSNIPAENPNPVIRINSDKTILYNNGSFNKLLIDAGLTKDDAFKVLPVDLHELIDSALEKGKPHIMVEAKAANRIISYNIIPIMEQGYVNLYGRDVTDRNKFEKELKDKVQDLEKFYEMAVGRELKMKELKEEIKALKDNLSKDKKD